jgi:hypothetical protein
MKDPLVLRHRCQRRLGSFCYPGGPSRNVVEKLRSTSDSDEGRSDGEYEVGGRKGKLCGSRLLSLMKLEASITAALTTQHNSGRVSSENLPVQATLVSAALVICEFNDRQMHTAIEV